MSDRIYLDHGATSFPKAPGVTAAVARFLDSEAGNPGRGGHRLTVAASRAIEGARASVARLLGADTERTLLGPGATFWLNTLLAGLLCPGDRVVTSALEHNAVMRPLRRLARDRGLEVAAVPGGGAHGVPSPDEIRTAVAAAPTRLVVVAHASNVSGAMLPVEEIAAAVAPVPVIVDGAQTAGSHPFSFAGSGLAAFACSGHKGLLGPPGVGVLLLAPELAKTLPPLVLGGTGSRSDSEEMPEHLPDRLEAGTPNGPGISGLGAACSWLAGKTVAAVAAREIALTDGLARELAAISGVHLHGFRPDAAHTGLVSFTVDGADTGELAAWLDRERGIMLRAGLHCAPAAHRRLGTYPSGTLRAGIGPFTSQAEVGALVRAIAEAPGRRG